MNTTSNATARLLHLLALHPDVQNRLQAEIVEAQSGEEISYDRLNDLPLLDSVCRETLRLYIPIFLSVMTISELRLKYLRLAVTVP